MLLLPVFLWLQVGYSFSVLSSWDECYTRYQLDISSDVNCGQINCELVGLEYGLKDEEVCKNIKAKLEAGSSWYTRSLSGGFILSLQRKFQSPLTNREFFISKAGRQYRALDDKLVQIVPRASLINNDKDQNSTKISDWEPVSDSIGLNQTKFYQFNVNATSTGLSSFYHILIFLSGNICTLPKGVPLNSTVQVHYGFNELLVTNFLGPYSTVDFTDGYMKGLAKIEIPENNNSTESFATLYTRVTAPAVDDASASWNYEFGVSQKDLIYQWDNKTFVNLVDADDRSALFWSGNFSRALSLATPQYNESHGFDYELYLYPYTSDKDYFLGLSLSWCAVRNGPAILSSLSNMTVSYVNDSNSLRQQFYVPKLNKSTRYVGYALQNGAQTRYGGTVFKRLEFTTQDTDACQLIYGLDFCSDVAYAVPANPNFTSDDQRSQLKYGYDNYTASLYQNFLKALSLISCETELDAKYSPLRSCDDCAQSYKNWLCGVTIPRCTSRKTDHNLLRSGNDSRSDYINQNVTPKDYYEILPCYNTCYALVRDCPPAFSFGCPDNISLSNTSTYFWDLGLEYATCNFVGPPGIQNWGVRLDAGQKIMLLCLVVVGLVI